MNNKTLLLYFPIIILFQIMSINFFPTNYEYVFSEGSKFFKELDYDYIDFYFEYQANTYFFSIIIALINILTFNFFDPLLIARIVTLSSYIFFYIGIINFFKYFQIDKSITLLSIIFFFLNPLIWTLSFRGYPDLIAAGIGFCACSIILTKYENIFYRRLGIMMMSISIVLKPISCIFLIINFFFLKKKIKNIVNKKIFIDLFCLLLIPCIYFLSVKNFFDFYLMSDKFYLRHKANLELNIIIKNFFGYLCFLCIFLFPIYLNIKSKLNIKIIILYLLILFFGFTEFNFFNYKFKELDFGFFNNFINDYLILFLSYTLVFIFFLKIYEIIRNEKYNKDNIKIIFTIIIFLFILSMSKPIQRYLIFMMPFILILMIKNSEIKKINFFMKNSIFIFMIINLISFFHMYENSNFHKKIYKYLKDEKILNEIKIKSLRHSLGFIEVKNFNNNKKYLLINKSEDFIKKFEKSFLGNKKIIYIEKNK